MLVFEASGKGPDGPINGSDTETGETWRPNEGYSHGIQREGGRFKFLLTGWSGYYFREFSDTDLTINRLPIRAITARVNRGTSGDRLDDDGNQSGNAGAPSIRAYSGAGGSLGLTVEWARRERIDDELVLNAYVNSHLIPDGLPDTCAVAVAIDEGAEITYVNGVEVGRRASTLTADPDQFALQPYQEGGYFLDRYSYATEVKGWSEPGEALTGGGPQVKPWSGPKVTYSA